MDNISILESAGLKATRQRTAILEALRRCPEAVTAQELHRRMSRRKSAPGLATIYRTLTALSDAGSIDKFQLETELAFRLCGSGHHHHLVCDGCGDVREIRSDAIEKWVKQVARRHGFIPTGHTADVRGLCPTCA